MDDITEHTRPDPGRDSGAQIHDITRERMMRLSPVLEETWRYWSSKRPGRDVPLRESLEPRAMTLILGHAMILDRVRPGTVRVRLGGRIPNTLMGMETRGLPVRAFFDLMQRGDMAELIERAFTEPATLEMDLVSDGGGGRLVAQMLILPLRDRQGSVTKALSVLVPERVVSDGPRRFRMIRHNLGPIDLPARGPTPPVRTARVEPRPDARPAHPALESVLRGALEANDHCDARRHPRDGTSRHAPHLRLVK